MDSEACRWCIQPAVAISEFGIQIVDLDSKKVLTIDVDNTALEHYIAYEHLFKQSNYGTAHKIYDIDRRAKLTPVLNGRIGILLY